MAPIDRGYVVRASLDRAGRNNRQKPRAMNSEIVYWLDALNGIGKSPDLHFGVLVKNTLVVARGSHTIRTLESLLLLRSLGG